MKVLLHTCCSVCALYPVEDLKGRDYEVTLFWYNPNIHPYTEYQLRLNSLRKLQELWNLNIIYEDEYVEFYKFLRLVSGKERNRCEICYRLRLQRTAERALSLGFDFFSTTLLVSPYQKFDKIVEIGCEIGNKRGISFLCQDFREGFRKAQNLAKELELYRQKYCGCIYSEAERYLKRISYE